MLKLLLFIILFSFITLSEEDNINLGLSKAIKKNKLGLENSTTEQRKLNFLIDLSWDYRQSDIDIALYYADKAIEFGYSKGFDSLLSKAQSIKSSLFRFKSELDSAIYYLKLSIETFPPTNTKSKIRINNLFGSLYQKEGKYILSNLYYQKSLMLIDTLIYEKGLIDISQVYDEYVLKLKANDPTFMIPIYQDSSRNLKKINRIESIKQLVLSYCFLMYYLGDYNLEMGSYNRAIKYFRQAIKFEYNIPDKYIPAKEHLLYSYHGMSKVLIKFNKLDSARLLLHKCKNGFEVREDSSSLADTYITLSNLHKIHGNSDSVLYYLDKSINALNNINYKSKLFLSILHKIEFLIENQFPSPEIEKLFNKIEPDYDNTFFDQKLKFLRLKSKYYRLNGKLNNALKFRDKLDSLRDFKTQKNQEVKLEELNEIYSNNRLQGLLGAKEKEFKKIETNFWVMVIISSLILLLLLLTIKLYLNQKKYKQQIEKVNKEIKSKNENLIEEAHKKQQLFNMLTHDINSPLSLSSKAITMINNNELSDEVRAKFLLQIEEALNRVSKLVQNILVWITSSGGNINTNLQLQSINDLVVEMTSNYEIQLDEKNIEVESNKHSLLKKIDVESMKIILNNILSNAIKFSELDSNLKINYYVDKLEIINNGILDSKQIEEIDLHKRTYSKTGTNGELGNGLGLEIIFNLCKYNNLDFKIISEENATKSIIIFKD